MLPQEKSSIAIQLTEVSYGYKDRDLILDTFSFDFIRGKSYGIVGASGCGKSTLLKIIFGLLKDIKQGAVTQYFAKDTNMSFVLQSLGLLPWKTVAQNIALPNKLKGSKYFPWDLVHKIGIAHLLNRWPNELSGGQQQRVALARALCQQPTMLLLDEPFSATDQMTREQLQITLRKLWETENYTQILVTHDISEAVFLCEKILIMSKNGRLVSVVDNPHFVFENWHKKEGFFAKCKEIRSWLEAN